jgi:hypothetical protein
MRIAMSTAMTTSARLLRSLALVIPALIALGCVTPEPVVRLTSVGAPVWIAGRAVETQALDGFRVAAAFDHQEPSRIGFRVEIENGGDRTIDVDPTDMGFNDRIGGTWTREHTVIDPEERLAELDATGAQEAADAYNHAVGMAPLLFLTAIGEVASVASGHGGTTTGLRTAAIASDMESDQAGHASAIQQVGAEKALWMNAALRRTTLAPGQTVSGFIYVPIEVNAQFVCLNVRVGGRIFQFMFKQVVRPVV